MRRSWLSGIGVIGCGYWGPKIVRCLTQMEDIDSVVICDLSEDRLNELTASYPSLEATTDYREVLEHSRVDSVIIATPIRTHYRLALEALMQGKNVLVEKPLAGSVAEAEAMNEAAATVGRVLMVGHTFQYNPAVKKLRELVRSGELGDIFYIDAARLNLGLFQPDINVIWDLAPHDISILLTLMGCSPEYVRARAYAHVLPGIDDLAHIDLHFPHGVQANVRVSWLSETKVRRVTVVGSQKIAVFADTAEDKLRVYEKRASVRIPEGALVPAFEYVDGEVEVQPLETVEPLQAQIRHFLDCIKFGRRPASDGRVGLEVVRILDAAESSRRLDGQPAWVQPSGRPRLAAVPTARKLEARVSEVG